MDDHKGHDTVSAAAERKHKQQILGRKTQRYQRVTQEKGKQLRQLRKQIKALQCAGDAAVDQNEKAYAQIIHMADTRRCAVKELIGVQQRASVSQVEAIADRLEKEICDLRKGEDDLKRLSLTEDHVHFLQSFQAISDHLEPNTDTSIQPHKPFDFVTKTISDWMEKMENMIKTFGEISETIQGELEPTTRQEFLLYFSNLSLDPNTAFENLLLSEENRKVTWIKKPQHYSYHPERFTSFDQVLCSKGLSGVCYWEVEWKGPRVEVAVCYKGADLAESGFGYTDASWCISLSNSGCTFWHNQVKTAISAPCSATIGVYLNHEAGSLSFYSVCDSGQMKLLHRLQTTFSQPLYAGFMVSRGSSVRIIAQK